MAQKTVNFGIVGTNFISDNFSDAVKQSKKAKLVAVYSRSEERGKAFANRHGIPKHYCDYESMLLDKDIDAIYVASPTFLHKEHSLAALKAGKHVLCEKMIALTHEEFLEMRRVSRECGKVLLEAMRSDYDGALELVEKNLSRLGRIKSASFEFCQYSSRYDKFKQGVVENAFDPGIKNSALSDIGIYPIHLAVRLFGKPTQIKAKSHFLENGFEAAGNIELDYKDFKLKISYSKIYEGENTSSIVGESGIISFGKINAPKKLSIIIDGNELATDFLPESNNMLSEIDAFCDTVMGDKGFLRFLDVTQDTMELIDKIYKAAKITF